MKSKKGMDEMIKGNNGKIKAMALIMVSCLALSLSACGAKDDYKIPYSNYDLSEYVTLGDYKGLEVKETKISVTDEEVQAEIQNRLDAASKQVEKKEGTAAEGDKVKIVYVGKLNGKAFEGGSTGEDGTVITLGSSGYIDGFDKGVVGMKVGEKKDLNLKFPADYQSEELKGKDVIFEVTLKAIMVTETPKYDLAFVKENSDEKSIEDYEESVKEDIKERKEALAENEQRNALWGTIMDSSKIIKYPETELEACKKTNQEYYESYAKQYGLELKDFISQYMGMDEKAYQDYLKEYSEAIVSQEMVMYSIAKTENISVSKSDYKEKLKEFMTEQGITDSSEFEKQYGMSFEEYAGKDNLMKSFLLEEVLEFVEDNAKVVKEA
ncbi:MAG: trigger factor [Aminipila sp.]